jgi:hypothetical protein
MRAGDDIAWVQGGAYAHGTGLLALGLMDGAWQTALKKQGADPLLKLAAQDHRAIQRQLLRRC